MVAGLRSFVQTPSSVLVMALLAAAAFREREIKARERKAALKKQELAHRI